MALFSMEPSTLKCWLVANLKIWAFVPMFIIIMIVGLVHNAFAASPIEFNTLLVYAITPAIAEGLITIAQQSSQPTGTYALFLFAPIEFMVLYHMGKFELSTGIAVWLWVSIAASITMASFLSKFAFDNSDEVLSQLFIFRSSNLEVFESRVKLAFSVFVEAFLILFITFAIMIMFAID